MNESKFVPLLIYDVSSLRSSNWRTEMGQKKREKNKKHLENDFFSV